MLPWSDNTLQTKIVRALPALAAIGTFAVAQFLFYYWNLL